jgi:hypothetical protein
MKIHLLANLFSLSQSTTVSFLLDAHARNCLYAQSKVIGEKVAFYFAVTKKESILTKGTIWR